MEVIVSGGAIFIAGINIEGDSCVTEAGLTIVSKTALELCGIIGGGVVFLGRFFAGVFI